MIIIINMHAQQRKLQQKYYTKEKYIHSQIIQNMKNIKNELFNIFDNNTPIKYIGEKKEAKLKKHFTYTVEANISRLNNNENEPSIIEHCNKNKYKEKNNAGIKNPNISICIMSHSLDYCFECFKKDIDCIVNYTDRNHNIINSFEHLKQFELIHISPKQLQHKLTKINKKNELIKNYPEFYDQKNDRLYYNCIYEFYTQNPDKYFKYSNNKSNMCDIVLVCLNNNEFSIFFTPSKNAKKINIDDEQLKKIHTSKHIFASMTATCGEKLIMSRQYN